MGKTAFATPKETYDRICLSAENKAKGSIMSAIVKGIMGGWMVGLSGYCASVMAALYYVPNTTNGASRAAFAIVFPTGLFSIILTGSDLYTGNTMSFTIALAKRKITIWKYISRLLIALIGNFIGAALGAVIFAGGVNFFGPDSGIPHIFVKEIAITKTSKPFWRLLMSSFGCNSLVCLAIWTYFGCNDTAGAFLTLFSNIATFAAGGMEHIIANFYILNQCLIAGANITFVDVYVKNFIPVLIGNTFAGACIIGLPMIFLYNERSKMEELPEPEKDGNQIVMVLT